MNWIKRIGNAIVRGWKKATALIMEIAVNTRAASTEISHTVITRLRRQEPEAEPSNLARGIGTLMGMGVLICGSILIGQYSGILISAVVAAAGSSIIGLSVFGHIMAERAIALVNPTNLICLGVMVGGLIVSRVVNSSESDVSTVDEEAPVVDANVAPMHS